MTARRPRAVTVVMISLSLTGPALASFLMTKPDQSLVIQAAPSDIDRVLVQRLSESAALVTALLELDSVPVVVHEIGRARSAERPGRVSISSSSALDYEARLEGEQHEFEAAAVAVSP